MSLISKMRGKIDKNEMKRKIKEEEEKEGEGREELSNMKIN